MNFEFLTQNSNPRSLFPFFEPLVQERCFVSPNFIRKNIMGIIPVDLEKMTKQGETLYQAIAITAKRARQINDEIKTEYMARISTLVPMEEEDDEFETTNFDQMRISLEIEKRGKPTLEALKEFQAGKLEFRFRDAVPE